jgi:hypothetical protein
MPTRAEMMKAVGEMVGNFGERFIIVDGFDGCHGAFEDGFKFTDSATSTSRFLAVETRARLRRRPFVGPTTLECPRPCSLRATFRHMPTYLPSTTFQVP